MKTILSATLITLITAPAILSFSQPAKADVFSYCYPVTQNNVIRNAADHPGAYADGYSEGRKSRKDGDAYKPRTAGGEFARGFEDGYYSRRFTGQEYAVRDKVDYFTTEECNSYYRPNYYRVVVPPYFRVRRWVRW
jgi:hypothetical protein